MTDTIQFAPTWTDEGDMKLGAVTVPLTVWPQVATLAQDVSSSGTPTFTSVTAPIVSSIGGYQHVGITAGITAFAGGGQTNATTLTTQYNYISTCATAADSIKLPTGGVAGRVVVIRNAGAEACAVFPQLGGTINALMANASYSVASGASATFVFSTATQIYAF